MAKTKGTPGPKPKYGERRDYHFKLPLDLAGKFEEKAKSEGGVIQYVEKLIRKDLELENNGLL